MFRHMIQKNFCGPFLKSHLGLFAEWRPSRGLLKWLRQPNCCSPAERASAGQKLLKRSCIQQRQNPRRSPTCTSSTARARARGCPAYKIWAGVMRAQPFLANQTCAANEEELGNNLFPAFLMRDLFFINLLRRHSGVFFP